MELIPRHIERHIVHTGDIAQIEGFRNLFNYLNTESIAGDLRQLVLNYFNAYPHLQPHLHPPLSRLLLFHLTPYGHVNQVIRACNTIQDISGRRLHPSKNVQHVNGTSVRFEKLTMRVYARITLESFCT